MSTHRCCDDCIQRPCGCCKALLWGRHEPGCPQHIEPQLRDDLSLEDAHELHDRAARAVRVLRHWRDALLSGEQEAITANSLDCLADAIERGSWPDEDRRYNFPDRGLGRFVDAVERSSFGTPEVRAAMRLVDDNTAERITDRVAELDREQGHNR